MINKTKRKRNIIKVLVLIALGVLMFFLIKKSIPIIVDRINNSKTSTVDANKDDLKKKTKIEETGEKSDDALEDESVIRITVTESSVNIRKGAGVDYGVIASAKKGDEFWGTGNIQEASNGRPWYEIHLDDGQTGWISSKVAAIVEE